MLGLGSSLVCELSGWRTCGALCLGIVYVKHVSCDRRVRVRWIPARAATTFPSRPFIGCSNLAFGHLRLGSLCCIPLRRHLPAQNDPVSPEVARNNRDRRRTEKHASRSTPFATPGAGLGPRRRARILGCGTPSGYEDADPPITPERAFRAACERRSSSPRTSVRAMSTSKRNATWLILPVVICLSQRLSHACVSMN
jgi:hypothetical protein